MNRRSFLETTAAAAPLFSGDPLLRAYYRDHYLLTAQTRANSQLNPGNGWVSRLCHEPRVSLAEFQQCLRGQGVALQWPQVRPL
jgi:hypothetical protein